MRSGPTPGCFLIYPCWLSIVRRNTRVFITSRSNREFEARGQDKEFTFLSIFAPIMRILELNFERTWRGGERQTLYDMLGFQGLGQQVAVLCRKGFPLQHKAQAEGL